MVENIDTDGTGSQKTFERVLIPEDSYLGVITGFTEVRPERKKQKYTDKDGNEVEKEIDTEQQRWIFSLKNDKGEIITDKDGNPTPFPMFIRVKVSKAPREGLSNSKMYDILDNAKLLEKLKEQNVIWDSFEGTPSEVKQKKDEAFQNFLVDNLLNKGCKVIVGTVNKGKKDLEYSTVKNILRFGA